MLNFESALDFNDLLTSANGPTLNFSTFEANKLAQSSINIGVSVQNRQFGPMARRGRRHLA